MCCELIRVSDEKTAEFYDDWYASGYMDEWPAHKKERIFEIIKTLNLPKTGDALDYGCGNGEFTAVLKQALPKWNVYGADISSIAVDNAKNRYPNCLFFLPSDVRFSGKRFDFLFTHHVLEHVYDVSQTWHEINGYLKKDSSILHVLPCGNKGSFEYNLCMLRKDGFDRESGNKFIFEDESHLRRLTTKQMNNFAIQHDLELVFDYYSNQLYGALDWITLLSPSLILNMTNPRKAKNNILALKLACLCILFMLIKLMRFPANTIDYKKGKMKHYNYYSLFLMLLIFYPFSKLTNSYLLYKSNAEWQNKRTNKNGSEMYLYYAKKQTGKIKF